MSVLLGDRKARGAGTGTGWAGHTKRRHSRACWQKPAKAAARPKTQHRAVWPSSRACPGTVLTRELCLLWVWGCGGKDKADRRGSVSRRLLGWPGESVVHCPPSEVPGAAFAPLWLRPCSPRAPILQGWLRTDRYCMLIMNGLLSVRTCCSCCYCYCHYDFIQVRAGGRSTSHHMENHHFTLLFQTHFAQFAWRTHTFCS